MKTLLFLFAMTLILAGCAPVSTQTRDVGAGPPGGNNEPAAIGSAGGGFPTGGGR